MGIKKLIKSSFLGRYLISELHCAESWLLPKLISDEKAVRRYYKNCTGSDLNLQNPQTFSEKLNWYKLNGRDPLMATCADKYAVREYVASKGYADTLNELYGVYDTVSDIDLSKLPDQFVLKAAQGSHMNIIVKDKKDVCWWQAKMMMRSWLHQNIYWSGREWVYKDIPRKIIAEKYLEDDSGELRDYKFFCYHGEPVYLQYDVGRFSGKPHRNYYDMDFNLLAIEDGTPNYPLNEPPVAPELFKQMRKMAADLAVVFQQARVDLYVVNGKIYFGEMTFFDGGGSTVFSPDEWNYKFSEKWTVTK